MVLSQAQLRALFPVGVPIYLADQTYAVPADDWMTQVFYPWFWQMRTALGLQAYTRRNDCDNFSRAVAQAVQDCHALTPESVDAAKADAVSIGEFWYTAKGSNGTTGPHAIDVRARETAPGVAELAFFEPQTGREYKLLPEEFYSCSFARF